MIQPTSTRGKLLISAVTDVGVHLFCHRPDHFAGHSLVACPFADNSSPHVYLRLLAGLLPPSTRQPGPAAVLLGQSLKLSLIFSTISPCLWIDRETSSSCFSRLFLCIFYDRNFEFQVVLIFLLHRSHDYLQSYEGCVPIQGLHTSSAHLKCDYVTMPR